MRESQDAGEFSRCLWIPEESPLSGAPQAGFPA
jgi:hypothetical protein